VTRIDLTTREWHELIKPVIPHASTDPDERELAVIRVEGADRAFYAVATDRRTLAAERHPLNGTRRLGMYVPHPVGEARGRGKWVHMGRVNSLRRLRYAAAIGCDSADGTYLAFGPDTNLPAVRGWLRDVNGQGTLFDLTDIDPTPGKAA
jgi:hypothetical protein